MKLANHTRIWAALLVAGTLILGGPSAATAAEEASRLQMVFIETDSAAAVKKLAQMGLDIAAVREIDAAVGEAKQYRIEAVIAPKDVMILQRMGLAWREVPTAEPRVMAQRFAASEADSSSVYHSFDEPVLGIEDQLTAIAAEYPHLTRLETIGYSHQRRPLLAMRLTKHPKAGNRRAWKRLQRRPEVLFVATHHAREWVATQMAMRLIKYLTENYGKEPRVTSILNTTQIWILPVANPDGYEYTFTDERLWRKNLRDNDGDGQITPADGVDLNRNFDSHWGLDDEGSSPILADYTYRGPAPNSEPETRALIKFMAWHNFKFAISYHTYGDLILYPWGWQVQTPCFDDPIFKAQAGTDENPAIWDRILDIGYDPGVGADLYTTNGDYTDWSYAVARVPSHTVELTYGYHDPEDDASYYGFEFPDDEGMVQTVFEDNLPFALAVMESAKDPAHPVSPVGIDVEESYHFPPEASWGREQAIEVLAPTIRNHLRLHYRINNGRLRHARFRPALGETYNRRPGLYFTNYRAMVRQQAPGDEVTYWIVSRNTVDGPYTYQVETPDGENFGNPILILSAEDYSGDYPTYENAGGPNYLHYYQTALADGNLAYDVWDVSQMGVPPAAELLSHYDVVIWYTGDDRAPTVPSLDAYGETTIAIRDFMNYYAGRLFATGQDLAKPAFTFGLTPDDFLQYQLGAFVAVDGGGMNAATETPFDIRGEARDPIFGGLAFSLTNTAAGADGADNQFSADTFLATSGFLPKYRSQVAARYDMAVGPFEPHGGDRYVYSQMADQTYKRLGGTFTVPVDDPSLSFWTSYDIEPDWDYLFVEISVADSGEWTTLPAGDLTTQETGDSCASGWVDQIHPHLANYMDAACNPEGITGEWHAFTGNSNGWQAVEMDLSAYAGQTVELYITYASDWGTQGLGVFVDDIRMGGAAQGFEVDGDLGGWEPTTIGSEPPYNNWTQMTGAGFTEGPVIRTKTSVLMGFGFEAIDTARHRQQVMQRVIRYLSP
ncbi:MAG: M14 family zinc carboxypeptidase [Desulfosarcinaceae bacterium]|nr:M14 family zinc carboxypeptidase [Desulfosarcinaceae bacterium]